MKLALNATTDQRSDNLYGFVIRDLPRLIIRWDFLIGVALCLFGLIFWLRVLASYEISRALPIAGGIVYVAMFFIGRFILKEQVGWITFMGIVCIIIGIVLLQIRPT